MDLFDHIKNLKPMAEAIVYLAENVEEVSQIEDKLYSLRSDIAAAEERLGQIAKAALEHAQMAEQAKSVVIEAQSKTEQMIAGAKAEATRIIKDAETQANIEGKNISASFIREHGTWQAKIDALKKIKGNLDEEVASRLATHDAVQASIDSLKARLG